MAERCSWRGIVQAAGSGTQVEGVVLINRLLAESETGHGTDQQVLSRSYGELVREVVANSRDIDVDQSLKEWDRCHFEVGVTLIYVVDVSLAKAARI